METAPQHRTYGSERRYRALDQRPNRLLRFVANVPNWPLYNGGRFNTEIPRSWVSIVAIGRNSDVDSVYLYPICGKFVGRQALTILSHYIKIVGAKGEGYSRPCGGRRKKNTRQETLAPPVGTTTHGIQKISSRVELIYQCEPRLLRKAHAAPTTEEDYDEAADRQVSLGLVFESLDGLMFRGLGQVRLGSSHRSCPLCFWL